MKKREEWFFNKILYLPFVILAIFLLSYIVYAEIQGNQNASKIKVSSNGFSWNVVKSTGNESQFQIYIEDKNKQKTKICLLNPQITNPSQLEPHMNLYDSYGNLLEILNRQQNNGTWGYCRIIDSEKYLRFGQQSTVVIYQETKSIIFSVSQKNNLTATLYKNISNQWNNTLNDVWVTFDTNRWKFGANDTYSTGIEHYKYIINSDLNPIPYGSGYIYGNYIINFDDICSKDYSLCSFNLIGNTLEITFYSQSVIDPIIVENANPPASVNINITRELLFSHLSISDVAPYNSLVAYWSFDKDSTTTSYDLTSNNNDGTYSGAVSNSSSGIYNNGVYFDGINDVITVANSNSLNLSYNLSISLWVNIADTTATRNKTMIAKGGVTANPQYVLDFISGSKFAFYGYQTTNAIGITDASSGITPVVNQWYHVVGVKNETGFYIYVNGTLDRSSIINANLTYNTETLTIGRRNTVYFNGTIDDVMIFNKALTPEQITAIYNNQSNRFRITGTQENPQFNISLTNENSVNVSLNNFTIYMGSNLSLRLGLWKIGYEYNTSDMNLTASSLISYWNLDNRSSLGENQTKIVDRMGRNNGTAFWTNPVSSGMFAGAYSFNDSNYINLSGGLDLSTGGNYTVCSWFKMSGVPSQTVRSQVGDLIYGQYSSDRADFFELGMTGSGGYYQFAVTYFSSSGECNPYDHISAILFTINDWYHICVNTDHIYINGNIDSSSSSVEPCPLSTTEYYIGGLSTADTNFNGTIDEVMIFNRSLTQNEVREIYVKGRAIWNYTDYQNITAIDKNVTFSISSSITNVLPSYLMTAGTNQFYSPYLFGNASYNFFLSDAIAPNVIILNPFNNLTYSNSSNVYFNVSLNEAGSCAYSLDEGVNNKTMTPNIGNTLFNYTNTSISDGFYTINVYCNDTAGNWNRTQSRGFFVNSVDIFLDPDEDIYAGSQLLCVGDCSSTYKVLDDNIRRNSVPNITDYLYKQPLIPETDTSVFSFTNFTSSIPSGKNISTIDIWIYGSCTTGACSQDRTSGAIYTPGSGWSAMKDFNVVSTTGAWYNATFKGVWSKSDLDNLRVNLSIKTPAETNTVYAMYANLTISDAIFPKWSNNLTNLNSTTPVGQSVYFNITINEDNPDKYIFEWYNGTVWANDSASYTNGQQINITKTINIDVATINWTWIFNDTSGNINQTNVWSIDLVADDIIPPTMNITSPVNGSSFSFSGPVKIELNVTAADSSGISAYWYNIDNEPNVTFIQNTSLSFIVPSGQTNYYTINVFVNDTRNNVNSSSTFISISQSEGRGGGASPSYIFPRTTNLSEVVSNNTLRQGEIVQLSCGLDSIDKLRVCVFNLGSKIWPSNSLIGVAILTFLVMFILIMMWYNDFSLDKLYLKMRRDKEKYKQTETFK